MGKKSTRKTYSSKGERVNVDTALTKAIRKEVPYVQKMLYKLDAWSKGKRTMMTVPNPNKNQTNKPFIRIEGNDPLAFGPYRREYTGIKIND